MRNFATTPNGLIEYSDLVGAEESARRHFLCLDRVQQLQVVRRLVDVGYSEQLIAAATGWSVEMVQRILGEGSLGS
jgi:hypothetical protein